MQVKVSVIIPCFNDGERLPVAIRSVREQDWPGTEIIVVDDGSTDASQEILHDLRGPDLRSLRQDNQGPGAARNAGIQAARGDWIAFLDADDYWLPGKLGAQFERLARQPNARFSYGGVCHRPGTDGEQEIQCDFGNRSLLFVLLEGNRLFTPTVVVRRDCFEETGLFHAALRTGEDWDLWLRLAARYSGVGVSTPLAVVNRHVDPARYPVRQLEECTLTVLGRLFSCPQTLTRWPQLQEERERVYAWQYAVLARSYAREKDIVNSVRSGLKAVMSAPLGFSYLLARSGPPVFEGSGHGAAHAATEAAGSLTEGP